MILKTPRFLIVFLIKKFLNIKKHYRTGSLLERFKTDDNVFYYKRLPRLFIPPFFFLLVPAVVSIFKYIFLSKVKIVSTDNMKSNFDGFREHGTTVQGLKILQESYDYEYDFIALIESIDKKGLLEPIILYDKPKDRDYYKIKNGNHRVICLQFLDNPNYNNQKVLIYPDVR